MADKKKFSLAEQIGAAVGSVSIEAMNAGTKVSESDTKGREQIVYLPRTSLVADEKNFYSMEGIEELAKNIECVGLLDPLRVRPIDGEDGLYRVVSGHRRRAAIDWLALNGNDLGEVACIVEKNDGVSPALAELRLIFANSDTRRMSDSDLSKQAERVESLLYQLKEEGFEFPGRMRDHVAEACKVSATKLANLKVIREKLPEQYRAEWEAGKMTTDAAYKLAKAPAELQARICKAYPKAAPGAATVSNIVELVEKRHKKNLWEPTCKCPDGSACTHADAFLRHDAAQPYNTCGGSKCCLTCSDAMSAYYACSSACTKAKQQRAEKQKNDKQKADERREKELGKTKKAISKHLQRLIPLIDAAGMGEKDTLNLRYTSYSVATLRAFANGDFSGAKGQLYDSTFDFAGEQGYQLKAMAKELNTTTDYLLGLTDDPAPRGSQPAAADAAPQWLTGAPEKTGSYYCAFDIDGTTMTVVARWDAMTARWGFQNGAKIEGSCLRWYPLPDEKEEDADK